MHYQCETNYLTDILTLFNVYITFTMLIEHAFVSAIRWFGTPVDLMWIIVQ